MSIRLCAIYLESFFRVLHYVFVLCSMYLGSLNHYAFGTDVLMNYHREWIIFFFKNLKLELIATKLCFWNSQNRLLNFTEIEPV